jgi:hypothetical protein
MPTSTANGETDFRPPPVGAASDLPVINVDVTGYLRGPGVLGTRDEIEAELDLIAAAIRGFHSKQPDQVMRETAGYSARLTELCVLLHRVEGSNRQYTRIRTQQVERFLAELDRQFKIASRLVEVLRQDLELMK